eukprot:TRINITY_DN9540_c0_g1_i1.p1 TRINITY_DN9540_c0_g1~~TRINITY_DN9540_c0_g1_i1.p1  ORF type:complete len:1017 (-),score=167.78 TRINITY_DN9540_c0_g1_i1:32-3082(-)
MIMNDLKTTTRCSGFVLRPSWLADVVGGDEGPLITPLDQVVQDSTLQWSDLSPFFRDYTAWFGESIYDIPLDGNFAYLFYRQDVFAEQNINPPRTWQEYHDIASQLDGMDFNGDNIPDYGSCLSRSGEENGYFIWAIMASFFQSTGTQQGSFFDPDTMVPFFTTDAGAAALQAVKGTYLGTLDEMNITFAQKGSMFLKGRCAMTLDWSGIGVRANYTAYRGKIGAVVAPGSTVVHNRESGQLEECTSDLCPYSDQGINHAPHNAGGGWVATVSSQVPTSQQAAALGFLTYIASPNISNINVMSGHKFDPVRSSQISSQFWIQNGMGLDAIALILPAMLTSTTHPNAVPDLKVQNSSTFFSILDAIIQDYLLDIITLDQAQQSLQTQWLQLVIEVGHDKIRSQYRRSLRIVDEVPPAAVDYTGALLFIIGASVGVCILCIIIGILCVVVIKRKKMNQPWMIKENEVETMSAVGAGGFGVVFRGSWKGTEVAIKRIAFDMNEAREEVLVMGGASSNSGNNDSHTLSNISLNITTRSSRKRTVKKLHKMFTSEVAVLSKLRHPNVLFLFGAYTTPSHGFLCMEFMHQGSLFDILHNKALVDHFSWKMRYQMALDAARGMDYLHRQSPPILHRDVKSLNFLVDDRWIVKVGDFGFASDSFKPLRRIGINVWTAPELMEDSSRPFTTKADVYSFGIVLWELLELADPSREVSHDMIQQITSGWRLPIRTKADRKYINLMQSCWDCDSESRPEFSDICTDLLALSENATDLDKKNLRQKSANAKQSSLMKKMFTPSELAEISFGGHPPPKSCSDVTILFSDIVGFTTISSSLPAEKVTNLLERLFKKFEELAARFQVETVDTIGDAFIAAAGFNGEVDHCQRVATLGLLMIEAARVTPIDEDNLQSETISIRVGIHTGPVVGSLLGGKFTLLGDTMNVASRMETTSLPNRVQTSQATYSRLKNSHLCFRSRGVIDIKGKGKMRTYFLLAEGDALYASESCLLPGCTPEPRSDEVSIEVRFIE